MALLQKITNILLWLFAIGQLGWSILSCIISSWLVFYYTDAEGVLYKYFKSEKNAIGMRDIKPTTYKLTLAVK